MQKIKKNLTAIEKKFESLKKTEKQCEFPTPIGQVAQLMTYGVIQEEEVDKYLEHLSQSPDQAQKQDINLNWEELDIEQMVTFLDKVIKYRNVNKPKGQKKKRLSVGHGEPVRKKKVKSKNSETHQNPFIPPKVQAEVRLLKKNKVKFSDMTEEQKDAFLKIEEKDKNIEQKQISPQGLQLTLSKIQDEEDSEGSQTQYFSKSEEEDNVIPNQLKAFQETKNTKKSKISKQEQLGLPSNLKDLPIDQRVKILEEQFQKAKKVMENRFNSIYKFYRKEMYIPYESFEKNNDLLMDLRIFLKYYKEFSLSEKYKASEVTQYFKKLALNGLWLDYERFIKIHYRMIEILELTSEFQENTELTNDSEDNAEKMKKQISRNAKYLMKNLVKLKELSSVISDKKIQRITRNKTQPSKPFVKKIVESHSGLSKNEVLLKLSERVQLKGLTTTAKKKGTVHNINTQSNYNSLSLSPVKGNMSPVIKRTTNALGMSVYHELKIPEMRRNEMKKKSIYSTLELLNMHKEKEKMKQIIGLSSQQQENESERILQQYFKKQKGFDSDLKRSQSTVLKRQNSIRSNASSESSLLKKYKKEDGLSKVIVGYKNNITRSLSTIDKDFSLPRMKFS